MLKDKEQFSAITPTPKKIRKRQSLIKSLNMLGLSTKQETNGNNNMSPYSKRMSRRFNRRTRNEFSLKNF